MKATYIIAILVALLLIVGCNKEVAPEPEPVAPEPEPEPVEEEPTVAEDAPAAASEGLSYESVDERAQRLIDACKSGNAGLCAALRTQYGIEVSPDGDLVQAEDMEAEVPVEE